MSLLLPQLKVPSSDKPDVSVNFRSLLLDRCQKEFEREKNDSETLDRKQNELDSAKDVRDVVCSGPVVTTPMCVNQTVPHHCLPQQDEELKCQKVELEAARGKARRRSLGSTKFIGELFKLKMLTVPIMDHCVMKLLKDQDEGSLDCLCWLFLKIGKNLDFKKAKVINHVHRQGWGSVSARVSSREKSLQAWVTNQEAKNPNCGSFLLLNNLTVTSSEKSCCLTPASLVWISTWIK